MELTAQEYRVIGAVLSTMLELGTIEHPTTINQNTRRKNKRTCH